MSYLFVVCISIFDLECSIVDFSSVGYRELLGLCGICCEILGWVFRIGWKWVWGGRYGRILRSYEEIESKLFM